MGATDHPESLVNLLDPTPISNSANNGLEWSLRMFFNKDSR